MSAVVPPGYNLAGADHHGPSHPERQRLIYWRQEAA
jgi:hypothetical protein